VRFGIFKPIKIQFEVSRVVTSCSDAVGTNVSENLAASTFN